MAILLGLLDGEDKGTNILQNNGEHFAQQQSLIPEGFKMLELGTHIKATN